MPFVILHCDDTGEDILFRRAVLTRGQALELCERLAPTIELLRPTADKPLSLPDGSSLWLQPVTHETLRQAAMTEQDTESLCPYDGREDVVRVYNTRRGVNLAGIP